MKYILVLATRTQIHARARIHSPRMIACSQHTKKTTKRNTHSSRNYMNHTAKNQHYRIRALPVVIQSHGLALRSFCLVSLLYFDAALCALLLCVRVCILGRFQCKQYSKGCLLLVLPSLIAFCFRFDFTIVFSALWMLFFISRFYIALYVSSKRRFFCNENWFKTEIDDLNYCVENVFRMEN